MVKRPTALTKDHDLSQFECGKPTLTDWLKKHALQSDASGHTKTMVITDGTRVIGYYSFAVVSVEHEGTTLPRDKKGLARYSIPIFLIARLAIDQDFQGQRLGSRLIKHALNRAAILAVKEIPLRAVVVDAIDDEAKEYYKRFDIEPWPIDTFRMWLLVKDLLKTLSTAPQKKKEQKSAKAKVVGP